MCITNYLCHIKIKNRGLNDANSKNMIVTYRGINAEGHVFSKADTLFQPKVVINKCPHNYYTLLMVDPDSTTLDFLNWMIVNINIKKSTFQEILPYYPPTPTTNSHRYFFYLFEQQGFINVPRPNKRTWFSLETFIYTYELRAVEDVTMRVV